MGGVYGRVQLRRRLLAPGNFRLSPAAGGKQRLQRLQ